MKQTIHVISDSIGETARIVTEAVSKQFNNGKVKIRQRSYVNHPDDVDQILIEAKETKSIIVYTIVIKPLREYLERRANEEKVVVIDILGPIIKAFERKFNKKPTYEPGLIREMDEEYFNKMEAIEFAVKYDDGKDPHGSLIADIVLIGVSRTSKTPLSMYLAHKGFKVANFPLVPEIPLPEELYKIPRNRCIGLVIEPKRLAEFRKERLMALGLKDRNNYTSLERILEELDYAEKIMRNLGCPRIDVSNRAIEETANLIIDLLQIERGI